MNQLAILIAGPSGAGKSTLARELRAKLPDYGGGSQLVQTNRTLRNLVPPHCVIRDLEGWYDYGNWLDAREPGWVLLPVKEAPRVLIVDCVRSQTQFVTWLGKYRTVEVNVECPDVVLAARHRIRGTYQPKYDVFRFEDCYTWNSTEPVSEAVEAISGLVKIFNLAIESEGEPTVQ